MQSNEIQIRVRHLYMRPHRVFIKHIIYDERTTEKETQHHVPPLRSERACVNVTWAVLLLLCRSDCVSGWLGGVNISFYCIYYVQCRIVCPLCDTADRRVWPARYTMQHGRPARYVVWYNNIIIIYEPGTAACRIIWRKKKWKKIITINTPNIHKSKPNLPLQVQYNKIL